MAEPTIETLARRLDRVERENRWLKRAGVVALAVMAASIAASVVMEPFIADREAQKVHPRVRARVVEAEKFVVKDTTGKIRANLSTGDGGSVGIGLYDLDGKSRIALNVQADGGSGLHFSYGNGARAALGVWPDGTPVLHFYDQEGKVRALLVVDAEDGATLRFSDGEENVRAVVGSTSIETTHTGAVEQRPESSLVLFSKAGKVIWSAP